MQLGEVMDGLYASEINCAVSTFWDGGYHVSLGDEMNGWLAETEVLTSEEAAVFLDREHESTFRRRCMCSAGRSSTEGWRCGTAPTETHMRLTVAKINQELARHDIRALLARGDGYFYFWSGEAIDWLDRTVKVERLGDLTLEQWVGAFRELERRNREIRKAGRGRPRRL